MEWLKKALVIFYIFLLGVSWLQLVWFFGYPSIGGFVLTPSAHPYIAPFSMVLTVPSNSCEGWSVKLVDAQFYGVRLSIPVVHYFQRVGNTVYETFNYYVLGDVPGYFYALVSPKWVAVPYTGSCAARVVAVVPTPIVILSFLALTIKLWYKGKRVW